MTSSTTRAFMAKKPFATASAFMAKTNQLLSTMASLRLLLVMFLTLTVSVSAWGATTTTYTFSSKSWAASPENWTSGKDGNQMQSGRGIQVSTGVSGANATSPKSFTNVSKVVVTYSTNASSGAGNIKIKIGTNTEVTKSVTNTGGTTDRTLTYDFSPNQTGSIKVTVTCSTNSIYIKSIAITEAASAVNHTVNWYVNGEVEDSQTDIAGTPLTNIPNLEDYECGGKVFVGWTTQSSYEHATDAPTGMITNTSGMTMPEGGEDYYAVFATASGSGSVTYSKTPTGTSDLVEIDNGKAYTITIADGIIVKISDWTSNVPIYHTDGQWRIYGGSTVTVSSTIGDITQIVFSSTQIYLSTSQEQWNEGTWTGIANEVLFTNSSTQSRITGISVTMNETTYTNYITTCIIEPSRYLTPKYRGGSSGT